MNRRQFAIEFLLVGALALVAHLVVTLAWHLAVHGEPRASTAAAIPVAIVLGLLVPSVRTRACRPTSDR